MIIFVAHGNPVRVSYLIFELGVAYLISSGRASDIP